MSTPEEYNKIRIKKLEKKLEKNHARQIKIKDELGLSEKGSSDAELDLMTQEAQETIGKIEAGTIHTPEATVTPEVSPTPVIMPKSLDETLDEIEAKARASIKENADAIADKALKGNQEEIDASTIRINQHNALKENIAELQKKRDAVTTSNDQSFEDKLVGQIDTKISELEDLNPYKSPEVETSEKETREKENTETQKDVGPETEEDENTEIQEQTDEEEEEKEDAEIPYENHITNPTADTVNELYKSDENSLNGTFNPREKSVAEAYKEGTMKSAETPKNGPEENPEPLVEKSPELVALEEARANYAEKQKTFLDNHRKTQGGINKIRDFFGFGKKIKEEQLPEELKELKSLYDQQKVAYGKSLVGKQIQSIEEKILAKEIQEEDKDYTLDQFMKGELFDEIVVKEREALLALQAETLPAKQKGVFKKILDGYIALPPWQRAVLSSALITGVMLATGAIASTGAAVSYGASRLARSTVYGATIGKLSSTLAGQAYDVVVGDSKENTALEKKNIGEQFSELMENGSEFEQALKKADVRYEQRLASEKKERYGKLITKALFGMGVGIGTSGMTQDLAEGIREMSDNFLDVKDSIQQGIQNIDTVKNIATQNALHEIKTGVSGAIKNVGEIGNRLPGNANEVKESLKEFFENTKESGGELLDKAKDKIGGIRNTIYEAGQTIESAKIVGRQATENFLKETGENIFSLKDQPIGYDPSSELPPPNISLDTPYTPIEKIVPDGSIAPIPDTVETLPPSDAVRIGEIETGSGNTEIPRTDTTIVEKANEPVIAPADSTNTATPPPETVLPPEPVATPTPETIATSAISVEADNLGAIETFKDLKEKLALSYPDAKLAPENVREILEGDPTKLAIKYGFYNPSQSAESALMQKGEEIGFDTKGNLYFKDSNGTIDYLSQGKGFDGKMVDLDTTPKVSTTPDQNIRSINPNDAIENSPNSLPKSINPSDGIENQQNSLPKSVDPNDAIAPQKTIPDTIKSINPNDEIGFRKNTFYTQDPEIDAMTPRNSPSSSVPATPETPTTRELLNALDAKGIHTLAEKEFTKDIDSVFQKPNFLMGGSTPGTQTEEWARTLRFIEEKKVTGNHIFEALDSNALQNTEQGEFFTLGEYVRSLKNTTGLLPNDGELLKDYILRAQEYKIEHKINSEDVLKIIDDAEKQGRLNIDEPTRNKIRVRRNAIDTDDVYN